MLMTRVLQIIKTLFESGPSGIHIPLEECISTKWWPLHVQIFSRIKMRNETNVGYFARNAFEAVTATDVLLLFFPLHERALFIVHFIRGQGVPNGGRVHYTHLESIPTFYPELIWLHLTSSKCQIDILIPHSHNCFLFSASTGLALWRTRTTATSRASPTLSARTTSGCFQSLVRCIFLWRRTWVVNGWMFHFVVSLPQIDVMKYLVWWSSWPFLVSLSTQVHRQPAVRKVVVNSLVNFESWRETQTLNFVSESWLKTQALANCGPWESWKRFYRGNPIS